MTRFITFIISLILNIYKHWVDILTAIGNIKVFKTPCFILYDPSEYDYSIRGTAIRQINNLLQPGDICLRSYKHYLDGFLIPGKYSHSGIYIGDNKVVHAVAEGVKEIDVIDFFQCDNACIIRPLKHGKDAANLAKLYIGKKYDFSFNTKDSSEFYCHELTAKCFLPFIKNIKTYTPTFLGIKLKCLAKRYLADSFLNNKNFDILIEL